MTAGVLIAEEVDADAPALECVLDAAFGPGRFAKASERVREALAAPDLTLSRVARRDGILIGGCRMSWIGLGGQPCLFLGPLAVSPSVQAQGLGRALVQASVDAAAHAGALGVLLVGRASFFQPLGFAQVKAGRVTLPAPVDPARLLWRGYGGAAAPSGAVTAPPAARPTSEG